MLKRLINFLFEPSVPELLLAAWVRTCLPIVKRIPSPEFGLFVMKMGMHIHKTYNSYWTFWLCYYLRQDTRWAATQTRMRANPLCPDSVTECYKELVFDAEPEEITRLFSVLPWTPRLTELYRSRQQRCGCKALI